MTNTGARWAETVDMSRGLLREVGFNDEQIGVLFEVAGCQDAYNAVTLAAHLDRTFGDKGVRKLGDVRRSLDGQFMEAHAFLRELLNSDTIPYESDSARFGSMISAAQLLLDPAYPELYELVLVREVAFRSRPGY